MQDQINQNDPIVDWVHSKYYKGKYNKEDIAKKLYSSQPLFEEALSKIYHNTSYKNKYYNKEEFISKYYEKNGNPFEVKKKRYHRPHPKLDWKNSRWIKPLRWIRGKLRAFPSIRFKTAHL